MESPSNLLLQKLGGWTETKVQPNRPLNVRSLSHHQNQTAPGLFELLPVNEGRNSQYAQTSSHQHQDNEHPEQPRAAERIQSLLFVLSDKLGNEIHGFL